MCTRMTYLVAEPLQHTAVLIKQEALSIILLFTCKWKGFKLQTQLKQNYLWALQHEMKHFV